MKRVISYLALLFTCLLAACSEKEEVAPDGKGPQTYTPFAINKGVNISNWLSQSDVRGDAREKYFTEAEVQQLAGFGFDHIRLPVDEEQLFTEDGQKIPEAFKLLHNAIKWCQNANMRVIVDLHILRSHYFNAGSESTTVIDGFIDNFESGENAWYPFDGTQITVDVVDNPDVCAANPSSKVLRMNKISDVDWMAGGKGGFSLPIGPNEGQFKYLRMKVRKSIKSTITLQVEGDNIAPAYTGYTNSKVNEWEDIALDLINVQDNPANGIYTKLAIRPDNGPAEMFIDDIFFSDSKEGNNSTITTVVDNTPQLWKDKEAQYKYFDLWKALADELKEYPNDLVAYELLNEPVAPYASQWNSLSTQLIRELRLTEPERKLVIGSNKWQGVNTFSELNVPANDPNIILSFHFYNPHLFTHYKAEWTDMKDLNVAIHYPGEMITQEDYNQLSDKDKEIVDPYMGTYNKAVLESLVKKAMDRAATYGLQLHCGEFGCYNKTPRADKINWLQDIIAIFRDNNIAYSYWEYKAGFGFCNEKGEVVDNEVLNLLTK